MEDFSEQQIKTLTQLMERVAADEGRATRDFVKASEERVKAYVDDKTEVVLEALADTVDSNLQPQLNKHDQRLTKLETKIA